MHGHKNIKTSNLTFVITHIILSKNTAGPAYSTVTYFDVNV